MNSGQTFTTAREFEVLIWPLRRAELELRRV